MSTLIKIKKFFSNTWQFFAGIIAMIIAGIVFNRQKDYSDTFEKQDKETTDHKIKDAVNKHKIKVLKEEIEKEPTVDASGMTDEEIVDYWKGRLK